MRTPRDVAPEPDDPAAGPLAWRVNPALPALKFAGAAAFALLGTVFAVDPVQLALAAAGAAALLAWAARDLVAPVRVAAGPAGVTVVRGYAGKRLVPWAEIERIGVDNRARLGLRSETLEIDTGESLHLFGPYELGGPPAEVAARLTELRSWATSGRGPGPAGAGTAESPPRPPTG